MTEGAIFDLDGTLLDSMSVWDQVGDLYLRSKGIVPPENLRETLKTLSLLQAAEYVRRTFGITDSDEEFIRAIHHIIGQAYRHHVALKPHVKPFLQKLADAGVRMCVATATERHLAEAALRRLDVLDYFSFIITCTEVGSGKDEPGIYEKSLAMLGTPKEQTVVFEDALHAVETAVKAGFRVVALRDGSNLSDTDRLKALAECYITSFSKWEVSKS